MASSVARRCFQVSRGATSPWRMVPKAPWMWPMWAASSTAASTGSAILTFIVMGSILSPSPAQGRTSDGQSARVGSGAEAALLVEFRKREPAGRDRSAPTGRLGPSFKSVSSAGRERPHAPRRVGAVRTAIKRSRRAPIVIRSSHCAPTHSKLSMIGRAGQPGAAKLPLKRRRPLPGSRPVQPQRRFYRRAGKRGGQIVSLLAPRGVFAAIAGAAMCSPPRRRRRPRSRCPRLRSASPSSQPTSSTSGGIDGAAGTRTVGDGGTTPTIGDRTTIPGAAAGGDYGAAAAAGIDAISGRSSRNSNSAGAIARLTSGSRR